LDTEIRLTKHIFGDLKVPAGRLLGVFGPQPWPAPGLDRAEIASRFQQPSGTPPLRELARGAGRVLIVTDDNTRPTPLPVILPPLLEELQAAGVPRKGVTFLVGLGTHRPMTSEEIQDKFGPEIASRYAIINHAWDDPAALVSLGPCDLGFEVVINRLVQETDLLLAVGNIVPHATAGFSGGGKAIMPGVCGEQTLEETHWQALQFAMRDILGVFDNPVRRAVVSVSRTAGLKAIVNTVLFQGRRPAEVVVGDVEAAHQRGAEVSRQVYGVAVPEQADVVIAEAYPMDIDLRQAIKAICAADLVCRDGGVVILPAECPEGAAPQFPEFSRYGFRDPEGLYAAVEEGRFPQKLMAYTLVAIGRIISQRLKAILVSPNLGPDQAKQLGFLWAPDLSRALDLALSLTGPGASVAVLKMAGELLPFLE
jgi:nickel-dependent lactate racemase